MRTRTARTRGALGTALGTALLLGALPVAAGAQRAPSDSGRCAPERVADRGTAFVDVAVVPMDRERLLQKRTVLVRGCRIEAIGHRDSVAVPEGYARVVGGDDAFLLPGLVDAHTHLRYDADLVLYAARGVTTVRNMEGSPSHLRWRREVREGAFGPRIITAGPTDYADAETREELTSAVEAIAAAGYDFVKVFDPLPARSYGWLIDAAGEAGLPIAGHIPRAVGAAMVLERQSHHTIEHAEQFVYHWFHDELDRTRIPELAALVKRSGTAVTPTLEVIHSWVGVVGGLDSLLARSETRWLHPETYAYWHTFDRSSSFENRLIADFQADITRELARQDVPLLAGTDMYMVGLVGPWALRREMRRMQEAGLSTFEVLRAATSTPAEVFGTGAGIVAEGRLADLLFVRGNPLRNLSALDDLEGVMIGGAWHPASDLTARLDSVEDTYAPGNAFVSAALAGHVDRAVARHRTLWHHGDDRRLTAGALSYVATILRGRGRYDDAITVYQLALEEAPATASAHEGIGRAYLAMGRIEEAVGALRRALDVDPDRRGARELLSELRP